jgi:hypothetical protein
MDSPLFKCKACEHTATEFVPFVYQGWEAITLNPRCCSKDWFVCLPCKSSFSTWRAITRHQKRSKSHERYTLEYKERQADLAFVASNRQSNTLTDGPSTTDGFLSDPLLPSDGNDHDHDVVMSLSDREDNNSGRKPPRLLTRVWYSGSVPESLVLTKSRTRVSGTYQSLARNYLRHASTTRNQPYWYNQYYRRQ